GGNHLYEVANFSTLEPDARLIIQNWRTEDPILALVGGGHEGGDFIQYWNGPAGGVYIHRTSALTSYQGLFAQPTHFGATAPRITVLCEMDFDSIIPTQQLPNMGGDNRVWATGNKPLVMGSLGNIPGGVQRAYEISKCWVQSTPQFSSNPINWVGPNST